MIANMSLYSLQELAQNKDSGFKKLTDTVEIGEKLYPNTTSQGRDVIRQEIRGLKQDWESLYDEVLSAQRQLEVNLVQWTSFEDSYSQLDSWLINIEDQIKGEMPLKANLEEKKTQLQNYRVCPNFMLAGN